MYQVTTTTISDIESINANQYCTQEEKLLLKQALDFQEMFSFKKGNKVIAIAMFYEFFTNCYRCGIVLSKEINPFFLRFFKFWLVKKVKEKKCKRLETEGINNDKLYKFHKFLGFKEEVIINNKEYIKWVK